MNSFGVVIMLEEYLLGIVGPFLLKMASLANDYLKNELLVSCWTIITNLCPHNSGDFAIVPSKLTHVLVIIF